MLDFVRSLDNIKKCSERVHKLKTEMLDEPRYMSVEQAKIITGVYQNNKDKPTIIKRALALREVLAKIEITIKPEEIIVGNRTQGVRAGVVSPESGISWLEREINDLPFRAQDKFLVREDDVRYFKDNICPYWRGKTLEDQIYSELGEDIKSLERVVKLNQKDHAQGHICPNVEKWLKYGPYGLKTQIRQELDNAEENKKDFYAAAEIVLEGAICFIGRYAKTARELAKNANDVAKINSYNNIAEICENLSTEPAETFQEAVQSMWFLFVILQVESNASSFSPGRVDQYLYPYYKRDCQLGRLTLENAIEIMEAVWIKFNQIVYMRNSIGASYFAGFPIGFNIAIGGQTVDKKDAVNELSYIMLKAQEHLRLPQPNLSARIHQGSPDLFVRRCIDLIGKGTGMPQIFNDESIIPALEKIGIENHHAMDYAVVGCVEISLQGNILGWSDAAMFNMVKVLELTLNNGICLQTGQQLGLDLGNLTDYKTYTQLEQAYEKQLKYFVVKMIKCCEIIEKNHINILPSPFLSTVIDDCIKKGIDVTAGGAYYNYSGIQAIQVANLADSMAALKALVYDKQLVDKQYLLDNLKGNYPDEVLRTIMLCRAPKYGNDVEWVDEIGNKWIGVFVDELKKYTNYRGGKYHVGLYTVSAHVPMGKNVGATPDGRKNEEPLADGGMSAVYGRDVNGPTALLKSVSRINPLYGSNGTLLNMKFNPSIFDTEEGINKLCAFIRVFIQLRINHVQFNVISKDDMINAKINPEKHRNLLVRVAGYTAYFVDLAENLQDEIITRTEHGM